MKTSVLIVTILFATFNAVSAQDCNNLNEEANRHMGRAEIFADAAEKGGDISNILNALNEYKAAYQYAPNCPDICYDVAYYAEKYSEIDIDPSYCNTAIEYWRKYLQIFPNTTEKKGIEIKIGMIEAKKEIYEKLQIDMVFVKGGTFHMGCTADQGRDCNSKESPVRRVTLNDFYIGKYEVTQAQWKGIMGTNPSLFEGDDLPVENVSWDDVQTFILKINLKTKKNYRLPTEKEWEYAARGGGYKFSGSSDIEEVAWYESNSNGRTHKVGGKKANGKGIYDLTGNVWEWCSDLYGEKYRIARGGCYKAPARNSHNAFRSYYVPSTRSETLGFRLACDADQ